MHTPATAPSADDRPPAGLTIGQPSTGRTTATIAALAQAFNASDRRPVLVIDPKGDLGPLPAAGSDR